MKRFLKFIILCILLKDCVHKSYALNGQHVHQQYTPNDAPGYLQYQYQQQLSNGFQSQHQMSTQYQYHHYNQPIPNRIENQPQIVMESSQTYPYPSPPQYIAGQHQMQVQYNSGAQQDPNFQEQYQTNKLLYEDGRENEASQYQYQDGTHQTQEQHMTNGYYQEHQLSEESSQSAFKPQGQISFVEPIYYIPNYESQPQETTATVPPTPAVLYDKPPIGPPNNGVAVLDSTQLQYQDGEPQLQQELQNSLENRQPAQTQTEKSEIEIIQPQLTDTIPKIQVITPNPLLVDINIQTDTSLCAPGVQGLLGIPGNSSKFLRCRDSQMHRKACAINTDAVVEPTIISETPESVCATRDRGTKAHPYDCSKYVLCLSSGISVMDCDPGKAFNVKLSRCDNIQEVQCNGNKTTNANYSTGIVCPNGVFGLFPYPFSTEQFINCLNGGTYVEPCPQGTTFSLKKSLCEVSNKGYPETVDNRLNENTHRIVTCPTSYNGTYLYPFDPRKYIICQNSVMQKLSCAGGHVFSVSKGTCMATDQTDVFDSVRPLEDMQPTDSKAVHSLYQQYNQISCHMEVLGVFPYPFANNKYMKCVDAGLLLQRCRPGFLYSLSRKLCDIREHTQSFDTAVPVDLNGSKLDDVDIVDSGDTNYLECPSGVRGNFVYPFLNTRYTKCWNGTTDIKTCLAGAIYSISRKKCLPRYQVDRNDSVEGIETSLKRYSNEYTLGVSCGPNSNGSYTHPEDWRKFLVCQDGIITVETCEGNKTFDMMQHKCV